MKFNKHVKTTMIMLLAVACIINFSSFIIDMDDGYGADVMRNYSHPSDNEIVKNKSYRADILLVLFTTFKEDSSHHIMIHRLAITNWAKLGTAVRPVLFTNQRPKNISNIPNLCQLALMNGWDVFPIQSSNKFGTPHLRSMYKQVFERYEATFYGYANGDLLFEKGLVDSLLYVQTILSKGLRNNVIMVGRRMDIFFGIPDEYLSSLYSHDTQIYLEDLNERFDASNLKYVAKGLLAPTDAIDYFILTRNGSTFKWSVIADVVIGRKGYDQYILFKAKSYGMTTIDLTRTALAVHLYRDEHPINDDKNYNFELIGTDFPYRKGLISSADYYSLHEALTNRIILGKMYPPLREQGCINFTV